MASIQRILVATDFSPCSRAALAGARLLAERLGAEAAVVHVWTPTGHISPRLPVRPHRRQPSATLTELARRRALAEMRDFLGPSLASRFAPRVEVGVPHELIVTLAAAERHDLIVMGARGAGRTRVHLGSVTRRMLDSAHCPVLVLRSQDLADVNPPGKSRSRLHP